MDLRSRTLLVLSLVFLAGPADGAAVTRGPYLQMGAQDAITIRWRTDVPVASELQFGTSASNLDQVETDAGPRLEHELRLSGLDPDTRYWYAISDGVDVLTGGDPDTWFRTSPAASQSRPLRIWVLGDSGLQGTNQLAVRDAYLAATGGADTDLVLMLGDNAYAHGTDIEYQYELFIPYADVLRNAVLWPARGNHDEVHVGDDNDYFEFFTLPTLAESGGVLSGTESWFSFDVGDVHFLCFDSFEGDLSPPSAMLDWITDDLAANDALWTIVLTHYPPYTKGSHDSDVEWAPIQIREQFVPALEAGGVDLVLSGHSHSYERSFLIDGHYGDSTTFSPSHQIDAGDGDPAGDGAYHKPTTGPGPGEGTVYAVAGSASRTNAGVFGHPAMLVGEEVLGSLVLEIDGSVLSAEFITSLGTVIDRFSIVKGTTGAPSISIAGNPAWAAPNPFAGSTRIAFDLARSGSYSVEIYDLAGRRVRALDGAGPEGFTFVDFDGRDAGGAILASGTYLFRVRANDWVQSGRMTLVR